MRAQREFPKLGPPPPPPDVLQICWKRADPHQVLEGSGTSKVLRAPPSSAASLSQQPSSSAERRPEESRSHCYRYDLLLLLRQSRI